MIPLMTGFMRSMAAVAASISGVTAAMTLSAVAPSSLTALLKASCMASRYGCSCLPTIISLIIFSASVRPICLPQSFASESISMRADVQLSAMSLNVVSASSASLPSSRMSPIRLFTASSLPMVAYSSATFCSMASMRSGSPDSRASAHSSLMAASCSWYCLSM